MRATGIERTGSRRVAVGRCPACGSGRRHLDFVSHDWIYEVPGEFELMRCEECASLYPDPRPAPDALAEFYPSGEYYAYAGAGRYDLFRREGDAARLWYATVKGVLSAHFGYSELSGSRILAATIGRLPAVRERATFGEGPLLHRWVPNGALLDVGSGAGTYLDLMRALGWSRVVGVDISEEAASRGRERLGVEIHVGDLRDVGLSAESFDAVTLSHALEHVDDPVAVLAEVRRVLRPNGRVAIAVPNVRSMLSRLLREHWLGLETPRHLVNFSPAGLRTAVERSGLRVESVTTSARGARGVALFSISRARGDSRDAYTNELHRFPLYRRLTASGLAGLERVLCLVRMPVGELIYGVARR